MYHLHLQVLFVPFPMLETPHSRAIVTALVSFLRLKIEPRSPFTNAHFLEHWYHAPLLLYLHFPSVSPIPIPRYLAHATLPCNFISFINTASPHASRSPHTALVEEYQEILNRGSTPPTSSTTLCCPTRNRFFSSLFSTLVTNTISPPIAFPMK